MSDDIEIRHYDGINCTPALELATRGWLENEERGHGENVQGLHFSHQAFVAFAQNGHDTLPVGVIVFDPQPHTKSLFIVEGYVLPEFRGRGIYNAMWNEIVAKAVNDKVLKIVGITSVRNTAMRAVAKRLGRTETAVTLSFDVPQLL